MFALDRGDPERSEEQSTVRTDQSYLGQHTEQPVQGALGHGSHDAAGWGIAGIAGEGDGGVSGGWVVPPYGIPIPAREGGQQQQRLVRTSSSDWPTASIAPAVLCSSSLLPLM